MIIRHHRMTAVLSAGALALALAACGSDEPEANDRESDETTQAPVEDDADTPDDGDEPDGEPEAPAEPDAGDVPWSVTFDGEPFEIRPDSQFLCFPMTGENIQVGVTYVADPDATDEELDEYMDHQFMFVLDESEDPVSVRNVTIGNSFGSVGVTYDVDTGAFDHPGMYADVEVINDHTFHIEGASINLGNVLAEHEDPEEAIEYDSYIIPFEIDVTCPANFRDMEPMPNPLDAESGDLDGVEGPSF